METIFLEQSNSTFICNIEENKNFSSLDYLSISNYSSENCITKCDSLINFNLELLNSSSILIHNAYLILPIEIYKEDQSNPFKDIRLYKNTEEYSYTTVTWSSRPKSSLYSTTSITRKTLNNKHISIDITELVVDWLYNKIPNYGITLNSETRDIFTIFPKYKLNYSPKLLIRCTSNSNLIEKPTAIYLQSSNLNGAILKSQQVIIFNNIIEKTPKGISYDKNTGIITISKKGYYDCHWEINLNGSDDISSINIALKNLTKNTIVSFYMPVMLQGQIVGNALLNVTENEEQFVLFNNSEKSLQLSQIQVQSSLLISIV